MDEKNYEVAFQIILHASEAKNCAFQAMSEARKGNFVQAEELLESAEKSLSLSHQVQTDILQKEAKGEKVELSFILVHAQDHLTMAIFALDLAREMIEGFKLFYEKKEK